MNRSVLTLNTSCGRFLIDAVTIVRIEASSNYCKIFFGNGERLVTAKVLKWFEERLPAQFFVRLNRRHLVNNLFLQPNQRVEKGLLMQSGEFIEMSRRRKKGILKQLLAA